MDKFGFGGTIRIGVIVEAVIRRVGERGGIWKLIVDE